MKSLAASNPHLRNASARKAAVERNVRSSSAVEGVSSGVFRSAATGQFVTCPTVERKAEVKARVRKQPSAGCAAALRQTPTPKAGSRSS